LIILLVIDVTSIEDVRKMPRQYRSKNNISVSSLEARKEGKMFRKMKLNDGFIVVSTVIILAAITACATIDKQIYHGYLMKGSVIDAYDSEIYLCIGKKDGATVGQELDAYHVVTVRRAMPTYKRVFAGKVQITEIIDEHFAKAKVLSGTVVKDDIVELSAP
jgi:CRISPR/Cas system-associated protein endoribonuclease Cas2